MYELSPAARAVLDAATQQLLQKPYGRLNVDGLIAAALRAAADYDPPDNPDAAYDMGWYAGMEFIKSIASELEAQ